VEATLTAGSNITLTPSGSGATRTIAIASTAAGGGGGTVTSVTGTAPIQVASGTTTPAITIATATDSVLGVVKIGTGLEVDGTGLLQTLSQKEAYWRWTAAAGTTPGSGNMQSSAANWAAATQTLYIHRVTAYGTDVSAYWPKIGIGDTIVLQERGNANNFVRHLVAGMPVLAGSVWSVAVTLFGSGGVEPNNNAEVMASFTYASNGGGGAGTTNLSLANNTANTLDVLSDTGTDVTLPAATGSLAGLFTAANFTKLDNAVASDATGITGADRVTNMVSLTQAEYDAIGSKNASTFYIIVA
jgi:hypothetical protein